MSLYVGVLLKITESASGLSGMVSVGGACAEIALDLVPQAQVGDALLVHAGVALTRMAREEREPSCV